MISILDPKGLIAADEKHIMITSALLMLSIVIPVIILSLVIAWRYRANNTKACYAPEWAHSTLLEIIWWTVPCVIIAILGTVTWISAHQLDPYRSLNINRQPIIIEAVALNWKWLFIYPEQHIATVNFIQFPVDVPIRFLIAAEGPMNSLQIPQLAGQIYAMAGMQTKLNLIANTMGDYQGMSTNFSGNGFSGMRFIARVSTQKQFEQWVQSIKNSAKPLTANAYNKLARPSENNPVEYYSSPHKELFNYLVMKSMMPMSLGK